MRVADLVELTRAPAAFSIPGDAWSGAAHAATAGRGWAMPIASTCLYWSGMAFNDWCDRHVDERGAALHLQAADLVLVHEGEEPGVAVGADPLAFAHRWAVGLVTGGRAVADDLEQHLRETLHVIGIRLEQVERDALRRFRPDTGQPTELVDEVLNHAFIHDRQAYASPVTTRSWRRSSHGFRSGPLRGTRLAGPYVRRRRRPASSTPAHEYLPLRKQ